MATVTLTTFLTLDGVMQAPGGPTEDPSDGFTFGGWQVPYADEDMGRLVTDWFSAADGFLLGRRTYDIFASYWPDVTDDEDPLVSALNTLPKFVVSRTLREPPWGPATVLAPDRLAEEVTALKQRYDRELQVHGSGQLAQELLRLGLVDELRLWTFPVVLGQGRRLFPAGTAPTALELVGSATTGAGATVHTYRTVGAPTTGSF